MKAAPVRGGFFCFEGREMARRFAKYCKINVAAAPHPSGIYDQIFKIADESAGIPYGRNWYAKIKLKSTKNDEFFRGEIGVWHTMKGKAVQTSSLEQQDVSTLLNEGAKGFGFPSKKFHFAFRYSDHMLVVEIKNDEGSTISPESLLKAFRTILEKSVENLDVDVSVVLMPDKSTISSIYELSQLRYLELSYMRPNPGDSIGDEKQKILEDLQRRNLRKVNSQYYISKGAVSINFDNELRAETEIASENGRAIAKGKNVEGLSVVIDTSSRPDEIKIEMGKEDSSYGVLYGTAWSR
jgi:hypothetical protein